MHIVFHWIRHLHVTQVHIELCQEKVILCNCTIFHCQCDQDKPIIFVRIMEGGNHIRDQWQEVAQTPHPLFASDLSLRAFGDKNRFLWCHQHDWYLQLLYLPLTFIICHSYVVCLLLSFHMIQVCGTGRHANSKIFFKGSVAVWRVCNVPI